jgi:hypothetical protein
MILDFAIPFKSRTEKTKIYRVLQWIGGSICYKKNEFNIITQGNFKTFKGRKNLYKIRFKGSIDAFEEIFANLNQLINGNNVSEDIIMDYIKTDAVKRILDGLSATLPNAQMFKGGL